MNLWICPRSNKPISVTHSKGENYALWGISTSLFYIFNTSQTNNWKNRLIPNLNMRGIHHPNVAYFPSCLCQMLSNKTNICYFSRKTNSLETGKRKLKNLLHSFCNNHRTLLLKHSAKGTNSVFPLKLKPSKSKSAFLCPLFKSQVLSLTTKAMPIV